MRRRTRNLAAASGMLALASLLWFNYSAVLPLIVAEWGLSGFRAGVIYSAFQAGYLLLVVPLGVVSDRYDARAVAAAGATVAALASLAFAVFARGFLAATVLRFVAGLGMAAVYVPGMRYVSASYRTDRGRAMGVYVGTFSVASGASFVLASWLASAVNWEFALAVTSLLALGAGPVVLLAGHAPPTRERRTDGISLGVLRNPRYLLTVGVYSSHNWELFGVRNWLPAFLVSTGAVAATVDPTATAGLLAGAMTAMGGVGNLLGGSLSDRVGRPAVIAAGLTASAVCSLVVGTLGWLPMSALVAFVLAYGVVVTVDSAPTSTLITEVVDADRLGSALSIQSFVGTIPGVVAPAVFGAALDASGYVLAFQTLGVAAVVGVGLTVALRRRTESRTVAGVSGD